MVGSAPQSQSQPLSSEEEALKRNTDCVYFLASPLTCKKGSECEYRHSDIARVNPRDCWFWLHSSCLNPKCGFRHPPLDGLLGTQVPTSSAPVPQNVTAPNSHVPSTSAKQGVPCIFFQKGYCLKGDWCPFLHVPNSLNNKAPPVPATASVVEPATVNKAFGGLEKSVQEKVPPMNITKPVKGSPQAKPIVEVEPLPPRNEFTLNRRVPPTSDITEFPGHRSARPVSNGNPVSWSSHLQQHHPLDEPESMNGKDAEEISREPSPGFDVLVDDEGRDSDYYPGEDRYGMSSEHDARNEYDISHSIDYNTIAPVDDERYQDPLGYEPQEHHKGEYAWEPHRASSGRISAGPYLERRPNARPESLGQVDKSDLRYRLARHKKPNGLRSVISHENHHDLQVGDRGYQGLRRDGQHVSSRDNSLGSRLQGRLRLPGRSSSPANRDVISSTDRDHGKLSPVRAIISSHQGRIRDRIKGRVEEASSNGGKNHRGPYMRRDIGDGNVDFAGPKSLAELKNKKNAEPSVTDQQSLGKRKHLMPDGHQQSGSDLSFEGPKPLEEILKRKRGGTVGASSGRNSSNSEDIIEDNNKEEAKNATNNQTTTASGNNEEIHKSTSVQKIEEDNSKPASSNSAPQPIANKPEAEDGMLVEDGADQEAEVYEHKDGESDYEQAGGEDFVLYDGENGDAEGEYLDDEDDDDDDFAKKMGVMYS